MKLVEVSKSSCRPAGPVYSNMNRPLLPSSDRDDLTATLARYGHGVDPLTCTLSKVTVQVPAFRTELAAKPM